MAEYIRAEGILMSVRNIGEADQVMVFYTKEYGRLDAMAKGVRLAKSKLRGHLTLFSNVKLFLASGREYWRLLDAERVAIMSGSKNVMRWAAFADFFSKLIVCAGESNGILWRALKEGTFSRSDENVAMLKVHVLAQMGLMPEAQNLKKFFSPRAVSYLSGISRDISFLTARGEMQALERGIKTILYQNNMV